MKISDLNLKDLNYKVVGDEIKYCNETNVKTVSKQLIYPSALITNMINETEKVEITYKVLDKWRTLIVDKETISNKNKIISLANYGVYVTSTNSNMLVNYLNDVIIVNQKLIPQKRSVSHVGWINDNFIPYNGNIIFDGENNFKPYYDALINTKGDYEYWKKNIAEFRKNLAVRLVIDSSFASVLLEITGCLPFVTLMYGKTGKGKTVTLQVAASVWGNPANDKLINSLDNTSNFIYRTMGFYHSIPGFFDELQLYKEKEGKSRLVMCLAQGIDRGKASKEGGTKAKETWKNAAILTGEDSISEVNSGGGTLNRLIEINVDEICKKEELYKDCAFASSVARENYGFAGREFIKYIIKLGKDKIFEIYKKKLESIKALDKTADKQAASMANILTADEILNMFLFDEEELTVDQIQDYLFSKEEIDISERAYDYIMGEVAVHNSNFVDLESFSKSNGGNIESYAKSKKEFWGAIDINEVSILKNQFERMLKQAGFAYTKTTKDWAQCGYLTKNFNGKNTHQTTVATIKGTYVKIKRIDREKQEIEMKVQEDIKDQEKTKDIKRKQFTVDMVNKYNGENLEIKDIWEVI